MPTSLQKAHEYLDMLEADRRTALALSEQKAEEARLIKARQEGFRAAMEMLAGETSGSGAGSEPRGPGRQRARRPIRQMILRELSFSGQTMTTTQIAKAIDYNSDRTKTALSRVHAHVNYPLIGKRPPEPLYHYRTPPDASGHLSRPSANRWGGE